MRINTTQVLSEEVSLEINVPAERAYEVMADFLSYKRWQSAICDVKVLREDQHKPQVQFTADVVVRKFSYSLQYFLYPEKNTMLWEYIEGDIEDVSGSFRAEAIDENRCKAHYSLQVDPGFFAPGFLVNLIKKTVMLGVLKDLKKEVEQ